MSNKTLWLIPVVLIAIVVAITVVSHNQRWTPDGFQYSRMALQDAGLSPADALARAEAFYIQQPIGQIARYREFLTVDITHAPPAPGPIFRTRLLYPLLVSLVYGVRGLAAPTDVSFVAYLVGTLLMYWLLLALARPWIAATGAILFGISPLILVLAESDLTDMLAVTLWIATLASLLHYMQSRRLSWILTFGLATLLLVLTKQSIYLPIGAVAGAFVGARLRRDVEDIRRSMALATVLGGITVFNVVWYALMHGAGIAKELEIAHGLGVRGGSASPDEPLSSWYRRTVFGNIVLESKRAILNVLPLLAVIAAAVDIRRKETAILIGAAITGLAPLFLDPSTSALARVLEAPLYPIVLAGLAIGTERLLQVSPAGATRSVSP
jgi:4-amino-4-deoxy-L-arabinose transferase-like glycosyltransferase